MKVLLTGGAGFIGQHVLRELLARGHDVRVMDSLRADVHAAQDWKPPAGVEFQTADVRDAAAIDRALAASKPCCISPPKVGLGVAVSDLPDYASSNDTGTAELLAGMARAGVMRLTLASSMVVYGEGVGHCHQHGATRPAPRIEANLKAGNFEPPARIAASRLSPRW